MQTETSDAILIELDGFLFDQDPNIPPTLKIHQSLNLEALELLQDTQEFSTLIGFCEIEPIATKALASRLEREGLNFAQIISVGAHDYLDAKARAPHVLRSMYNISCYIDETEDSPWHQDKSLSRLKF
jgi:hypothetical protein